MECTKGSVGAEPMENAPTAPCRESGDARSTRRSLRSCHVTMADQRRRCINSSSSRFGSSPRSPFSNKADREGRYRMAHPNAVLGELQRTSHPCGMFTITGHKFVDMSTYVDN